jgi:hypothetical protein
MLLVKKLIYPVVMTIIVLSGLVIGTMTASSETIPEPSCVCAGCGKACGSGHTATCEYR